MTTLHVTLPTNKAGQLSVFTVKFNVANFDKVVEALAEVKSIKELNNNTLWEVI